uniref:Uncharacterized protein n=1 Tax=Magallana gigas TaxID=29159 RepID=A0A8W8NZ38_MAGGI
MQTSTTDGCPEDGKNSICISSDEYRSSSNVRDDSSYSVIQEEISECFKFIKTFINNGDFVKHVRNDSPGMEDIEDKLDQNLLDLKRTDCSIAFAGDYFIYLIKNA